MVHSRRFRRRWATLSAMLLFTLVFATPAPADEARLLRFPAIHGDAIAFVHGGDLWRVPASGGDAVRLTTHPGQELFPRFSPDGSKLAFTGQYNGDEQVYVMPAAGGEPRQLTWYPARGPLPDRWGFDNKVYGWTPDGDAVLFRSLRDGFTPAEGRLFLAGANGAMPEALPMPSSGAGAYSPDGTKLVYSPLFRDFRTWKRYEGGWAQDLYIFDLESGSARQITDHPRTDRDPMWLEDAIYFVSDRDDTLNLYRYDLDSEEVTQVTSHTDWDVRWPSSDGERRIVYEHGGRLRVLDVVSGEDRAVSVRVSTDAVPRRAARIDVADTLQDAAPAPDGKRVAIIARGELFSAPAEHGATRNLTRDSGSHAREAAWSPNGRHVAYISDATGEEELYVVDQAGGEPRQLTRDGNIRYYHPVWSPDSERIAFSDASGRVHVVAADGSGRREVARDGIELARDYTWSPDGQWLALSLSQPNQFRAVHLWSRDSGELHRVTPELFHEHSPAWHPDGRHLYLLGMREYQPQISNIEWDYAGNRNTAIYALALTRDAGNPFPPRSDEVGANDDADNGNGNGNDDDVTVRIELDGLAERVVRVPVDADNYTRLHATAGHLVYQRSGAFYYGRSPKREPAIQVYDLEAREAKMRVEGMAGWALSADGSTLLTRNGRELRLRPLDDGDGKPVPLRGLRMDRVPADEWAQIFHEVWRRFRDHFYVENMHGYDWDAIREQYAALLPYVAHRSDLNYVIGEMIAELNVSHAYISGGDLGRPSRPTVSLPGARFAWDDGAGRYRIERIYTGHNAEDRYRSPLTEVGVDVAEGDYVLAINGHALERGDNPYRLLDAAAGEPVELEVASRGDARDRRTVMYEPVTSEQDLIYLNWVLERHRMVSEATDGRVGYLHIPDMGPNGIREFIKWFYPQIRKDGLIIDVRGNGGGNVSQMLINRLNRELLGLSYARHWSYPTTYPSQVFTGPMATLISQTSASDGDIFPWNFRKAGLGPLIGKRTWGGIVGITNRGNLIDGGEVSVPEFGSTDADGEWAVEGYGVDPDIEVEQDPAKVIEGRDPQLERAIEEVLEAMRERPAELPPRPEAPVRTP